MRSYIIIKVMAQPLQPVQCIITATPVSFAIILFLPLVYFVVIHQCICFYRIDVESANPANPSNPSNPANPAAHAIAANPPAGCANRVFEWFVRRLPQW
jgi:hypothetical protein